MGESGRDGWSGGDRLNSTGSVWSGLGMACRDLGRLHEAAVHRELRHMDRALHAVAQAPALAREARFRRAAADSLLSLSPTHQQMGHPDAARTHAELMEQAGTEDLPGHGPATEGW
ncbi:hypothetical protein ACFY9Q_14235 [Streptomyces sp. NPDC012389]|uniref:hypothetical protein n=1 Tax=Streptomyces sp. NPDC012389 TaxID=3364830 RepID=UPI0036EEA62C